MHLFPHQKEHDLMLSLAVKYFDCSIYSFQNRKRSIKSYSNFFSANVMKNIALIHISHFIIFAILRPMIRLLLEGWFFLYKAASIAEEIQKQLQYIRQWTLLTLPVWNSRARILLPFFHIHVPMKYSINLFSKYK